MTNEHRPDVFTINDEMYYFADDIKACFPDIFKGTGDGGVYDFIKIKDMKTTEYIHADFQNDSWIVLLERTIFTYLFLSKKWVEDFVKKNNIMVCNFFGSFNKLDEIVLRDDEKITDENGKPLEIHMVRDVEKKLMYFNMNDIINCNNEMRNYYNTITYYLTYKRRRNIYHRTKHNQPLRLSIYFTYYGILAFMTKGNTFPFLKRLDEWIHKMNFVKNTGLMNQYPSSVSAVSESINEFSIDNTNHIYEITTDIIKHNIDDSIILPISLFDKINDMKKEEMIQKTIVENNETEYNSVFKCIIDLFEITFTSFCW